MLPPAKDEGVLMIFSYLPWVAYLVVGLMVVSTMYMNGVF
jgi:hypothetical protein